MPIPFIMPKMDMDQESVVIIEWLKKEGDLVEKGEPVIVVETDKITSEVEAPASGKLVGFLYQENEEAPVTKVVAYILKEGETKADLPKQVQSGSGDHAEDPGALLLEDKDQTTQVATPVDSKKTGDLEPISYPSADGNLPKQEGSVISETDETIKPRVETPATPLARRIAAEENVNLNLIQGTGPRGRVQAADVKASLAQQVKAHIPTDVRGLSGETIDVSNMRQRIAERLTASYQTTPHIYQTVEVDMSRLEANRKLMNELAVQEGLPKISLTAYMVRITAWSLKRHPYLNASFARDKITFWKEINIGIATALESGLIVPVIHNADQLMVNELNKRIKYLAQRAHSGELTLQEIQGGTFTISNMGMYGIQSFTSIINPPQSAILSIGAIKRRPVVVDDEDSINVRPIMMITLAADHRIVDGAVAANFLVELVEKLENPEMLSI